LYSLITRALSFGLQNKTTLILNPS
jgi:hypothetical protein